MLIKEPIANAELDAQFIMNLPNIDSVALLLPNRQARGDMWVVMYFQGPTVHGYVLWMN